MPGVSDAAYVSESAVIIGNVEIKGDVYIAPHTTVRADEPGSAIIIGSCCNIQDNVSDFVSRVVRTNYTNR